MRSERTWARELLLSAVLGGLVVGCGSSDEDTASKIAADMCAVYRPCCQKAGLPTSQQACLALFGAAVAGADQAAAQQCLHDIQEQAKAPDFCDSAGSAPRPASCEKAFPAQTTGQSGNTGTTPPGGACDFADDCAPSTEGDVGCAFSQDANGTRFCQIRARAAAGESCIGDAGKDFLTTSGDASGTTISVCYQEDHLYCEGQKCQAIVGLGGACTSSGGCTDSYCHDGVCSALLGPGGDCSSDFGACEVTAYCKFEDGLCHAKSPTGTPCRSSEECLGFCVNDACSDENPIAGGLGLLFLCE